jgi:LytR cell envelope-related transcriptional attenuator
MSTPKNGGPDRRLRTAGIALISLAVMAATIGVVLVFAHSRHPTVPSPTPTIAAPPQPPTMIPFPPPVPTSSAVVPFPRPAPVAPAPPAAEAVPAGGPAGGTTVSRGEVRVYNNSTIRGLAARVARDLTAAGWTVVEVGNYPWGIIPTTTVYYQDDFSKDGDQRADAAAMASAFGMRAEPRSPAITHVGPGLIVIVTNDYRHWQ